MAEPAGILATAAPAAPAAADAVARPVALAPLSPFSPLLPQSPRALPHVRAAGDGEAGVACARWIARVRAPITPWVAAALSIALAAPAWWPPRAWPSSDLDGHIATIALYARALGDGQPWPYDHASGLGADAIPYYGWGLELALGACARSLMALGGLAALPAATIVAVLATVLGVAALSVSAAWCAQQLSAAAHGTRARAIAGCAGAGAAWVFLAAGAGDGYSGYGMEAVQIGLLPQTIGWSLLLVCAGAAAGERRGRGLDAALALALGGLALAHALSAAAGAVVAACAAARAPRRVAVSALAALAVGAAGMASVAAAHARLTPERPWCAIDGADPLLAVLAPLAMGDGAARLALGAVGVGRSRWHGARPPARGAASACAWL